MEFWSTFVDLQSGAWQVTLAPSKEQEKKVRIRGKTVWKALGGGWSWLNSAKEVKHRAMPRLESGISQPSILQVQLRKHQFRKLSGSRTRRISGLGGRQAMELRGVGAKHRRLQLLCRRLKSYMEARTLGLASG